MRRRHDCATSLLEYLAAQMRTVPPPSPPVGDGLDSSGGTSVPNGFLVCLQEPPTNRHGVTSLGKGNHLLFQEGGDRPRAAIFASAHLSLWKLPNFTEEDVVTASWSTGNSNIPEIIVCSVYLDGDAPETVPPSS